MLSKEDQEMLKWVQFVTDKFGSNHTPWKYSRDTGKLKHIRYEGDYTGYNHWKKRVKRFFRNITVGHFSPKGWEKQLSFEKNLWEKIVRWPMMVVIHWRVSVCKDTNMPDGQVNGIITHWEEDGEYIAMMSPYVGRQVLKFLNADPTNPHAQEIIKAMREAKEVSWPNKEEEEDD